MAYVAFEINKNRRLSIGALCFVLRFGGFLCDDKKMTASNGWIAVELNTSKRNVQRIIQELIEKRIIVVKTNKYDHNRVIVLHDSAKPYFSDKMKRLAKKYDTTIEI